MEVWLREIWSQCGTNKWYLDNPRALTPVSPVQCLGGYFYRWTRRTERYSVGWKPREDSIVYPKDGGRDRNTLQSENRRASDHYLTPPERKRRTTRPSCQLDKEPA